MSWIFGKTDEKEQQRKEKKELRTATRELATDYRQLERKERELELEIKALAKAGQTDACKILARQLVQIRKQKDKNTGASSLVSAVSSKNSQAHSMQTLSKAMATTAQTMGNLNSRMPVQKMVKDMRDFEQQTAMMDMRDDIIDETLDSMLEVDEGEQDRVIDQVLDEIGIETKEKMVQIYILRQLHFGLAIKKRANRVIVTEVKPDSMCDRLLKVYDQIVCIDGNRVSQGKGKVAQVLMKTALKTSQYIKLVIGNNPGGDRCCAPGSDEQSLPKSPECLPELLRKKGK